MNCHGNHDNNNGSEHGKNHKGPLSHMLMMLLCCAAPIIILLLLPLISKAGDSRLVSILPFAVVFICPLMMIGMMFKGGKRNVKADSNPDKQVQLDERSSGE